MPCRKTIFLTTITIGLVLIVCEVAVRIAAKTFSIPLGGYQQKIAENWFAYYSSGPWSPLRHDPQIGWRAGPRSVPAEVKETYNDQHWRSAFNYKKESDKKRVALIGCSFTFGSNLDDNQTIATQLQRRLGPTYEVLNFSAEGYGLNHMAVLATQIAPKYKPDFMIIGMIEHSLHRHCLGFAWNSTPHPYYSLNESGVQLKGQPVPSRYDVVVNHANTLSRIKDTTAVMLSHSRLLRLAFEPLHRARYKRCLVDTNLAVLKHIENSTADTPKLFVTLQGTLPEEFEAGYEKLSTRTIDFSTGRGIDNWQGKQEGTSDGFHPDEAFADYIASVYATEIQKPKRAISSH